MIDNKHSFEFVNECLWDRICSHLFSWEYVLV